MNKLSTLVLLSVVLHCTIQPMSTENDILYQELVNAIVARDDARTKEYLDNGASANYYSNEQSPVLQIAISMAHHFKECHKIIDLLLEHGADVWAEDVDGTIWENVCRGSDEDLYKKILQVMLKQPSKEQRAKAYAMLRGLQRTFPEQYSNLRNLFKPLIIGHFKASNAITVCRNIVSIENDDLRANLLNHFFSIRTMASSV